MESHEDLKSMYAELVENLNCSMCHDTLKEPRDLDCGHTYCLECLQELVAIKGWTSNIKCCLCQEKTSIPSTGMYSLKQNHKLNCILDEQAAIMMRMGALSTDQASATPRQEPGITEATETLQIWVRDLRSKSHSFHVRMSDTADALKRQVEKKICIPPNVQVLIYNGKLLEGSKALEEYGMRRDSTIELTIPLK